MQKNAREREANKKEVNKTGGGSLTAKQMKILKSPLYEDLANKLGKSATGSHPRFDSDADAGSSAAKPPTARLQRIMSTSSTSTANHGDDESIKSTDDQSNAESTGTTSSIMNQTASMLLVPTGKFN